MNPIELGLISVQQHDEDELDASKILDLYIFKDN